MLYNVLTCACFCFPTLLPLTFLGATFLDSMLSSLRPLSSFFEVVGLGTTFPDSSLRPLSSFFFEVVGFSVALGLRELAEDFLPTLPALCLQHIHVQQ